MVVATQTPTQIVKRNGLVVQFDASKIALAIVKCYESILENVDHVHLLQLANEYTDRVINIVGHRYEVPTVEQVQDTVEMILLSAGEYDAAKHYILYRAERTRIREEESIPEDVLQAFKQDNEYFPTPIQRFQFFDKYARWNTSAGRRETWVETVRRTRNFLTELTQNQLKKTNPSWDESIIDFDEIEEYILNMKAMPSMRLLAMAGEPARRDNATLYNCSYLPIDGVDAFCELMSNCMAGCGVGYSVESDNVDKIPKISKQRDWENGGHSLFKEPYVIDDSAEGWVQVLRDGLTCWISGYDLEFDFSKIRLKGTVLRTKGGQASGPEPLRNLLNFIRSRIIARQGKKLRTIDAHDIACAIGNAVVSGGVRRTALISIFDEDDELMLHCKDGDFDKDNPQRWNANNSVVWSSNITQQEFVNRMHSMFSSERGEPGIFSREVAKNTMPSRRDKNHIFGTNPCGEIVLRPWQFCNLSIVVARPGDTIKDLKDKVRIATIIGTIQSCATYFPNLRSIWKINCEQERLLGVDITGQYDNELLNGKSDEFQETIFTELQLVAVETNKEYAQKLGINQSASVTCVKPSGNSAQLLNTSSGIHPRWAPYYIRNARLNASSPLVKVFQEAGVSMSPENGQDINNVNTWVVSFPIKAPEGAPTRNDVSAVAQCNTWLLNKIYWTEHNPSVTITYTPEEVLHLMDWVWKQRHRIGGMTFLPRDDARYDQLPYIEITEEEYNKRLSEFPTSIPWHKTYLYEHDDRTTAAQELACVANVCEAP